MNIKAALQGAPRGEKLPEVVGRVSLVGAGPGDPELLTMKAIRAITQCDVLVHDRLVSKPILDIAGDSTLRISVGKAAGRHSVPQHEINALLVTLARAGKVVCRLKGGDPFIFGRGGEEIETLAEAGIAWTVVPGITAAQGCAAAASVPLTHRGLARSVRYVTGHCRDDEPLVLDWAGLTDPDTTLVVYMGHQHAATVATELLTRGRAASTPVLCISQGTTPSERRFSTRIDRLASDLAVAKLPSPVLYIIGEVVDVAARLHDTFKARATAEAVG